MIIMRLVVLIPKVACPHTVEKPRFSRTIFLFPPVVLQTAEHTGNVAVATSRTQLAILQPVGGR